MPQYDIQSKSRGQSSPNIYSQYNMIRVIFLWLVIAIYVIDHLLFYQMSSILFCLLNHLTASSYCEKYRSFTWFPGVEILWKGTISHSFGRFARNYVETLPFHKIFTPGN